MEQVQVEVWGVIQFFQHVLEKLLFSIGLAFYFSRRSFVCLFLYLLQEQFCFISVYPFHLFWTILNKRHDIMII